MTGMGIMHTRIPKPTVLHHVIGRHAFGCHRRLRVADIRGCVGVPVRFRFGCIVFRCLRRAWVDIRGMICIQYAAAFVAWRNTPKRGTVRKHRVVDSSRLEEKQS